MTDARLTPAEINERLDHRDLLAEHARGDARRATFLEAFAPVDIVGVWPDPEPFVTAERARGRELRADGWIVWCDGRLL